MIAVYLLCVDIYSESCIFQDEIDKYSIDQYIKGTKALFDASNSHIDLIDDVISKDNGRTISFKFKEKLTFNIPLFKPYVYLSGYVDLTRDVDSGGLITYSHEHWDKTVTEVLKDIKF